MRGRGKTKMTSPTAHLRAELRTLQTTLFTRATQLAVELNQELEPGIPRSFHTVQDLMELEAQISGLGRLMRESHDYEAAG